MPVKNYRKNAEGNLELQYTVPTEQDVADNYVDFATEQTISAKKTFDKGLTVNPGAKIYLHGDGYNTSIYTIYSSETNAYVLNVDGANGTYFQFADSCNISHRLLQPEYDGKLDLGTSSRRWKNFYVAGNISDATNSITVADIVAKQDALTAGDNITITDATIAAKDTTYSIDTAAGNTITLTGSDGTSLTKTINDVSHASSADSATYANTSNSSVYSTLIKGADTRYVNSLPGDYIDASNTSGVCASAKSEFKKSQYIDADGTGSTGFSQLLTFTPWTDNTGGYPVQMLIADASDTMKLRYGTADGDSTKWTDWASVVTSATLNNYTIAKSSYATSAGSATKATSDGNGNNIANRYARVDWTYGKVGTISNCIGANNALITPLMGCCFIDSMTRSDLTFTISTYDSSTDTWTEKFNSLTTTDSALKTALDKGTEAKFFTSERGQKVKLYLKFSGSDYIGALAFKIDCNDDTYSSGITAETTVGSTTVSSNIATWGSWHICPTYTAAPTGLTIVLNTAGANAVIELRGFRLMVFNPESPRFPAKAHNAYKADSATNATNDGNGNVISSTYATAAALSAVENKIILPKTMTSWTWGTLTTANGYTLLGGYDNGAALGIAAKDKQLSIQIDGRFYDQEGKYRLVDTNDIAAVAISGSYNDLTDKPTIPAAVTVDSALSSTSTNPVQNKIIKAALDGKQAAGSYAAASHTHTKSQITDFPTIPTKTSQLTNDSGFTTNTGTVTSVAVKMNGSTKGTVTSSGTIDLGTVLTSHQSLCISTTYANLKSLRDGGTLTPGATYRITDYEFTTTQAGSSSAGHGFDILVIADDAKTLNENARAVARSGDTYYSDSGAFPSDLSAWELKYCIDNDLSRFSWADASNGKGVIYYLKDDRGNIAPYDHKNCLFIRYKVTNSVTALSSLSGQYLGTTAGVSTGLTKGTDTKTYLTFDRYCYDNRLEPYRTSVTVDGTAYADTAKLNDITICAYSQDRTDTTSHLYGNTFEANCHDITFAPSYSSPDCCSNSFGNDCYAASFGNYCDSNSFGDSCYSNSFGNYCYSNSFGNSCYSNIFGNSCHHNSLGNSCYSNIFGNMCCCNIFGNMCYSNSFGNSCHYNSLGNSCYSNSLGTGCFYNSFGIYCYNNSFGEGCCYNSFRAGCGDNIIGGSCYHNSFGADSGANRLGDSCFNNSFGNGCLWNYLCSSDISSTYLNYAQYNTFESGVSYVSLYDNDLTGSLSACLQNVHIHEGVKGTSSSRKVISVDRNLAYGTDVYAEGHVTMTV